MGIRQKNGMWTRKHDLPGDPLFKKVPIDFPDSLEYLIDICSKRKPTQFLKAAGSHWALSDAAISDDTFIETHDPNNAVSGMDRTLYGVVPGCLTSEFINILASQNPVGFSPNSVNENEGSYFIHFETGKRVYQLYAELDFGDEANKGSLANLLNDKFSNKDYFGPWAFQTLGGAGGQTVFGALTTGTHGGDVYYPPIADSIQAMHLVTDGGKHYWIERSVKNVGISKLVGPSEQSVQMTSDKALNALYGKKIYGGIENFTILRDDDIFNSVLISAGRFGVVYSVVMRVVRQYCLHDERRLDNWQDIKELVKATDSSLYMRPELDNSLVPARFLQIAISVTPHENFKKNRCGITKRWNVSLAAPPGSVIPFGRLERCGVAPPFPLAGKSRGYDPDSIKPNQVPSPTPFQLACANSNFMVGVIEPIVDEISTFIKDNKVLIGGVIAAIAVIGGIGLLLLIPALILILPLLKALLDWLKTSPGTRLGEVMNAIRDKLLNNPDPSMRAAGIFVWQGISLKIFEALQKNRDYEAISYAVMDGWDYLDMSCDVNVDSIEVFFDVEDPMLIVFVDALLAFEIRQELIGLAFVGYLSLRFTSSTKALLGMEKFVCSCAVEVSCLKDARGGKELIDFAVTLARDKNFKGILHWGQRNDHTMAEIQDRFGDSISAQGGPLHTWRNSLSLLTEHGRLNAFSSKFTRKVGLEIVTPIIYSLSSDKDVIALGEDFAITWDCKNNPPYAETSLHILNPTGGIVNFQSLALVGQTKIKGIALGLYTVRLKAICRLNGEARTSSKAVSVTVV